MGFSDGTPLQQVVIPATSFYLLFLLPHSLNLTSEKGYGNKVPSIIPH